MARGTAAIARARHPSALNAEQSHAARPGTWVPGSALSAFGWLRPAVAHAIAAAASSKQKRKERE
jgi:hypothetical protein